MADDLEAHFEPFGFLGIERQRDPALRGSLAQRFEQLGKHRHARVPMCDFIARVERGEFYRDRMPRAGRFDGGEVGGEIAFAIFKGPRGFTQHVETGRETLMLGPRHALGRFSNGAPHHEDFTHHPHRSAHSLPHKRFARARDKAPQRSRVILLADQRPTDHQPPGRRIDQSRMRLARMRTPVCVAQLVRDQGIGGFRIGDTQKRLCQRQQRDAFLSVETVFLKELIDPTRPLRRTQIGDQVGRARDNHRAFIRRRHGMGQEGLQHLWLGCAIEVTHNGRCGIHDL